MSYKKIDFEMLKSIDGYFTEYKNIKKVSIMYYLFLLVSPILIFFISLSSIFLMEKYTHIDKVEFLGIKIFKDPMDLAWIIIIILVMFLILYLLKKRKRRKKKKEIIKQSIIEKLPNDIPENWIEKIRNSSFGRDDDMGLVIYKDILFLQSIQEVKGQEYQVIKYVEANSRSKFYKKAYVVEADAIIDYTHDISVSSHVSGGHNNTSVSTTTSEHHLHRGTAIQFI